MCIGSTVAGALSLHVSVEVGVLSRLLVISTRLQREYSRLPFVRTVPFSDILFCVQRCGWFRNRIYNSFQFTCANPMREPSNMERKHS